MRILVVGSGGREHALCWAIAASPLCDTLYCAPGNAGIAEDAECVAIKAEDLDGLVAFAKERRIDYVVVGPEGPLVLGLVDRLEAAGIKAFGPSAAAAALEGSKGFMKDLCAKHGIPTAAYGRFTEAEAAKAYIREAGAPIVVKADGLAAGKGVVIAESLEEALAAEPDDALVHYNLACYWSLAKNKRQALVYLSRALDLEDEYRTLVPHEPDFDPVRDDPAFQTLVRVAV